MDFSTEWLPFCDSAELTFPLFISGVSISEGAFLNKVAIISFALLIIFSSPQFNTIFYRIDSLSV